MSNPRVLYCGNYRDGTGWSHGAMEYIRALDAAGVDVACRPIKFNSIRGDVHPRVLELELRTLPAYDAVIQNVLPHLMDYSGRFTKNIGLYYVETSNFRQSGWADSINCMDEAWVCCRQNEASSHDSGVTVPTRVFPIPCDVTRYERRYQPLSVRAELAGNFLFYTIGEQVRRKNLRALITAFHLEFDVDEPVSLLIKTSSTETAGQDSEWQTRQMTIDYCTGIKRGLKLYSDDAHYKQEIIFAGRFSDHEIMRFHASCDCGVFPSYGDAWSIPSFNSMALGKTPIVTGYGGFLDYMSDEVGWVVPVHMETVFGTQGDTFPNVHTAREEWAHVEIGGLRAAMRSAFSDRDVRREKGLAGTDRAYDYSYAKIGQRMKEAIIE